jgi:hypothetical protein
MGPSRYCWRAWAQPSNAKIAKLEERIMKALPPTAHHLLDEYGSACVAESIVHTEAGFAIGIAWAKRMSVKSPHETARATFGKSLRIAGRNRPGA